jgi:hypothetical protein
MKSYFFAAALLAHSASVVPVFAQASTPAPKTVEDACVFVAKSMLMVKELRIGVVQSFPELSPPGARLTYSTKLDAKDTEIDQEIECQFDPDAQPLKVTRFCMDSTCYAIDSEDQEDRRRLLEVQALMARLK